VTATVVASAVAFAGDPAPRTLIEHVGDGLRFGS
jgi:hypothetical protein